jgi:hypothetical protein
MNYPIVPDIPTQAAILYGIDRYLREVINDEEIFMVWLAEGCPDDCKSIEDVESCLDLEGETFREWIELANRLLEADANDEPERIDNDRVYYDPYDDCFYP